MPDVSFSTGLIGAPIPVETCGEELSSSTGLIGEPIPAGSSPRVSPEGGGDPIVFELVGEAGNSDERDGDQCRGLQLASTPSQDTASHRGWCDSWPSASPPEPRRIDSTN